MTQTRVQNFTSDNFQNIYVVTLDNELVKFDPRGRELFRYPNKTLGRASLLDATNPFQLLLFFPEYQSVLLLDRTLSPIDQFNLFQWGLSGVHAIGMAGDGRIWVYDEATFRLKKLALDGAVKAESGDLSLILNSPIHPDFLTEREQQVFLNDPAVGILVFDAFGQYLKTISIQGLHEFQVLGDQLIFCKEGRLRAFHLKALIEQPISTPAPLPEDCKVLIGKEKLYLLEGDTLKVFPIQD